MSVSNSLDIPLVDDDYFVYLGNGQIVHGLIGAIPTLSVYSYVLPSVDSLLGLMLGHNEVVQVR